MGDDVTYLWSGSSGKKYEYWINPIEKSFKPMAGNYIFVKKIIPDSWFPLYVGETDNLGKRLTPNHEKMDCVRRYGVTHVHTHISSGGETIRQKEESDIRNKWNPPCNLEA
jgi:hypothetical protein